MNYSQLTDESLKEFHQRALACLKIDDETPQNQMKPYGLREYHDWAEHIANIEEQLQIRDIQFSPIDLNAETKKQSQPISLVLYNRIKQCLIYEDNLPEDAHKPYQVREHSDWKAKANEFEKDLDNTDVEYEKIKW
ncbi:hypothetical protein QNE87_004435 [Vibrio vulnificus]|nr:hypothetical protein [Vibrio vulnificus]